MALSSPDFVPAHLMRAMDDSLRPLKQSIAQSKQSQPPSTHVQGDTDLLSSDTNLLAYSDENTTPCTMIQQQAAGMQKKLRRATQSSQPHIRLSESAIIESFKKRLAVRAKKSKQVMLSHINRLTVT